MNITARDKGVLQFVLRKREQSIIEIAHASGFSEGLTKKCLDNLFDAGLVEKRLVPNASGGKKLMYSLTPAKRSTRPLYESTRLDARPLARAFGSYTFTRI